ncbi:hypothetical protein TPAU25S_01055 [Tsukamurella paurometabola]
MTDRIPLSREIMGLNPTRVAILVVMLVAVVVLAGKLVVAGPQCRRHPHHRLLRPRRRHLRRLRCADPRGQGRRDRRSQPRARPGAGPIARRSWSAVATRPVGRAGHAVGDLGPLRPAASGVLRRSHRPVRCRGRRGSHDDAGRDRPGLRLRQYPRASARSRGREQARSAHRGARCVLAESRRQRPGNGRCHCRTVEGRHHTLRFARQHRRNRQGAEHLRHDARGE